MTQPSPHRTRSSRRMCALLALACSSATALAAEPTVPDAQRLEPALDGRTFTVVDAPYAGGAWTGGGGVIVHHAQAPLVLQYDDGRPDLPLVESVSTAEVSGWLHVPGGRIGVSAPLHLDVQGYETQGARSLGDLRIDAMGVLRDRGGFRLGLGGLARLPTGDATAWVGSPGPIIGGQLRAGWTAGKVEVGSELGVRSTGGVEVGTDDPGIQMDAVLGSALHVTPAVALVGELASAWTPNVAQPWALEPIATVRYQSPRGLAVRAGAGTGLLGGIGEADWRILAGVSWIPGNPDDSMRLNGVADTDRDGIPNDRDLCVEQAEDINGVSDDDGCPEAGLIPTRLEVVDRNGRLIADASLELTEGPTTGSWRLAQGSWHRSVPAGRYEASVTALGHTPQTVVFEIPEGSTWSRRIELDADTSPGRVRVLVTDPAGRSIHAQIELTGPGAPTTHKADSGAWAGVIEPGTYTLRVTADGHLPVDRVIEVSAERTVEVSLALPTGQVRIDGDQIVFTDRIYFDAGSDTIQRRSFPLLEEIAGTMVRHPELTSVAVRGHTDDRGSDAYNLDLSLRRAQAVVQFLEASGVEAGRLQAFGLGEHHPLLAGTTEDARSANRRVEFRIVSRSSTADAR